MGQIKNIKLIIVTDIKVKHLEQNINNRNFFNNNNNNNKMAALRKMVPLFDRVLVQRLVAETSTKSGILLPEKSVGKINEGTVVAVGAGARDQNGAVVPPAVAVGDSVVLPEYGGTKLEIGDQEFMLFKEAELLGKFA